MGLFQDEAFSDALKFALAAGMSSYSIPYTVPVPLVLFTPPTCHDLTNPTTMTPFTTLDLFQSIQGSTKTLQTPCIALPLHMIFPMYALQARVPPPQWVPSPCSLSSALWNVVKRTAELSACGAVALTQLFSQIIEATPKKNLACFRDDEHRYSCDSLDLSSLPSIPAEDDLLRVDVTALESIPSSELYIGDAESVTAVATVSRLLSAKTKPSSCLPSGSSDITTIQGGSLPSENLMVLHQILNDELYFDFEDLGKQGSKPPWPFNSSAFAAPTLLPA